MPITQRSLVVTFVLSLSLSAPLGCTLAALPESDALAAAVKKTPAVPRARGAQNIVRAIASNASRRVDERVAAGDRSLARSTDGDVGDGDGGDGGSDVGDAGDGGGGDEGGGDDAPADQELHFAVLMSASAPVDVCGVQEATARWFLVLFAPEQCALSEDGVVVLPELDARVGEIQVDVNGGGDGHVAVSVTCDDGAGHTFTNTIIVGAVESEPYVSLDVNSVTPTQAQLAWSASGVDACTLEKNGAPAGDVDNSGALTLSSNTESGFVTYTVGCGDLSASRSIYWGQALSVQDFAGARAIVGDVTQQTSDFITDYTDTELRLVSGNFEIDFDPDSAGAVNVAFADLEQVGANVILVDNLGVASFSFPALTNVGVGIDVTGDDALDVLSMPALVTMGAAGTFAAADDPHLSCDELAAIYCGLQIQGDVVVHDDEEATCPAIVPGC